LLTEKGLRSALQDYVQTWSRLRGIAATFRQELPEDEQRGVLEPEQEEALFRVMQEALSNVARHSAAWSTEVRLASQGLETVLSIIDNGNGFDAEQIEPGFGMHSMQERLSALGGTVKITSVLGQGTAVVASIPALSKSEPFPGLPLPLVPEHSAQR
jgi:signal transduction histidine kinase